MNLKERKCARIEFLMSQFCIWGVIRSHGAELPEAQA